MNIPNFLSLLRIILVPVIVIFLIQGAYFKALIAFTFAGLTDALDGTLARLLDSQTVLGAYLDPIADKLLVTVCFVTLSVLGIIPGWLTVLVISRDFIILLGIAILALTAIPYKIKPAYIGKVTTVFQVGVVFFAMLFLVYPGDNLSKWVIILNWLTGFFTVASGLVYIIIGVRLVNAAPPKGVNK